VYSPTPAPKKINNKGPANRRKHTQTYMHTHYNLVHRKFCIKHILAGCPGQGVQYTAGCCVVMPLMRLVCVYIRSTPAHNTVCICQEMKTAVTLIRFLFPKPQRALQLLKVPDLHLHLLSFRDRINSCSCCEGGREGISLNQKSRSHLGGRVALQAAGRPDTPPAVHCLPSPSAR